VQLMLQIALVAVGSACGGVARWGVATSMGRWLGTSLPWGTFLINITGSFFLGWLLTLVSERLLAEHAWLKADHLRLALAVGFTGSYTTFSTFEFEAHGLLRDGESLAGTTYLLASVLLGLLAVRLGVVLARTM
jgi:CrcB protein